MVKKEKALHNYGKNNCCHWKWWRCYIFMVGVVAYLWSRCIIMAKKMRCTIAGITVLPLVLLTRISGAQCSYYTSCYWHPTRPEQALTGSREFSGRDFPIFFIPGFRKKFRDFHFCFICLSNRIIFINIYHHHLHSSPTILLYHHHSLRSLLATLLSHYPQIDVRNID